MGYLRDKYKKSYYLKEDTAGNATTFGVAGIEEYRKGTIRYADEDILSRLDFNDRTVLDIGCGRGEAVKYAFDHRAAKVIGVDFSEDAISLATAFMNKHNVKAELHCADALPFLKDYAKALLPNTKSRFDVVLMLDSIEHIPRSELTELLTFMKPLMSARGILAVNTPHFGIDNDVIVEGLKDLAWDGTEAQDCTAGMHCNRYTIHSLKVYLRRLGYRSLSHHLFAVNFPDDRMCFTKRGTINLASALGYPILLPQAHRSELYEGYSWRTHPLTRPLRWLYRRWKALLKKS
jgi:2-polyprenyl-3-methyl-5-hydroxy-6-metoxy-1,4-benzoquinol methylase